jgi:hypothetical protein
MSTVPASFPSISLVPERVVRTRVGWLPYVLISVHLPLGMLLYKNPLASTAHAVLTLAIGLFFVLHSRLQADRVAYLGAYIVGAEVLWRMTGAVIPWEFGKYGTSGIFILALMVRAHNNLPKLPIVFFALLLPSVALTFVGSESSLDIRNRLSFYMSGPFALMVSSCFFANIKLSVSQMQKLFLALICPSLSIATITLFSTLSASTLKFTSESNFTTSGGFGPNQVAGALGLGALMAFLYLLNNKTRSVLSFLILGAMVILIVQSALTFSRGGLYNAAGGAGIACLFLVKDRAARTKFVIIAVLLVGLGYFVLVPSLDAFTGGAFSIRFADLGVAHRDDLMRSDLRVWQESPLLGLGPGMLAEHRAMPHTEFTRLVAEHGAFGLAAIVTLLVTGVSLLRKRRTKLGRSFTGAMLGWSILFMLDKAMRLAAPAFAFGLAFISLSPEKTPDYKTGSRVRSRTLRMTRGKHSHLVNARRDMRVTKA